MLSWAPVYLLYWSGNSNYNFKPVQLFPFHILQCIVMQTLFRHSLMQGVKYRHLWEVWDHSAYWKKIQEQLQENITLTCFNLEMKNFSLVFLELQLWSASVWRCSKLIHPFKHQLSNHSFKIVIRHENNFRPFTAGTQQRRVLIFLLTCHHEV